MLILLLWRCGRWGECALSAEVFAQSSTWWLYLLRLPRKTNNNNKKNRLIPAASFLLRQEGVTVAVLRSAPGSGRHGHTNLQFGGKTLLTLVNNLSGIQFWGTSFNLCPHVDKTFNLRTLPAIVLEAFLCHCVHTVASHSQLSEVLFNRISVFNPSTHAGWKVSALVWFLFAKCHCIK